MGDIDNPTSNITIYNEVGDPVELVFDQALNGGAGGFRLAVDVNLGTVSIGAIVNRANIFLEAAEFPIGARTPNEEELVTYTVPTGKKFDIVAIHANSDSPLGVDIRIKVNGVVKMKLYIETGTDLSPHEIYLSPTVFAVAGDVVTATSEALMRNGEISFLLTGIES